MENRFHQLNSYFNIRDAALFLRSMHIFYCGADSDHIQ